MTNSGPKADAAPAQEESARLAEAQDAARKQRNLVMAGGLVLFIVLIFLVTVLRLSQNIASGG